MLRELIEKGAEVRILIDNEFYTAEKLGIYYMLNWYDKKGEEMECIFHSLQWKEFEKYINTEIIKNIDIKKGEEEI